MFALTTKSMFDAAPAAVESWCAQESQREGGFGVRGLRLEGVAPKHEGLVSIRDFACPSLNVCLEEEMGIGR